MSDTTREHTHGQPLSPAEATADEQLEGNGTVPGAVAGTGSGAIAGGLIGAAIGGPPGAILGAVTGGAAGVAVGQATQQIGDNLNQVTPAADRPDTPGEDSAEVRETAATGALIGGVVGVMGAESLYGATTTGGLSGSAGVPIGAAGAMAGSILGSELAEENEEDSTQTRREGGGTE
ncbi:MAG: hypothetical protein M3347_10640 [Armatimonadota bacterium]|nr:hypothetical protein [Armatimonadota bacterium]